MRYVLVVTAVLAKHGYQPPEKFGSVTVPASGIRKHDVDPLPLGLLL